MGIPNWRCDDGTIGGPSCERQQDGTCGWVVRQCSSGSSSSSDTGSGDIVVVSPQENAVVKSPLTISGKARGTWYFEASFPVVLLDDQGNQLATTPARAQGDWMTENYVPFTATLTFATARKHGTLVLKKDNPSGLPGNDRSVSISVQFP